jgi:hypothetical protein
VRKGIELLLEAGAEAVEIFGDSKLVISQLTEELLFPLWVQCQELMSQFRYVNFYWIPRIQNSEANDLAQMALGYKAVANRADLQVHLLEQGDWRADIFNYLKDPARVAPKRICYKAKWVEAVPMKSVASKDVINFVKEHVIHVTSQVYGSQT